LRLPIDWFVGIPVRRDFVTSARDASNDLRIFLSHAGQHEKSAADTTVSAELNQFVDEKWESAWQVHKFTPVEAGIVSVIPIFDIEG